MPSFSAGTTVTFSITAVDNESSTTTSAESSYLVNSTGGAITAIYDIQYTTDVNLFLDSAIPKIQYSNKPVSNALFFQSANLLFEQNVRQQDVKMSIYKNTKIFFLSSDMSSCLPFDPFAASFYMLTRYLSFNTFS